MMLKIYRAYFPVIMVTYALIDTCVAQLGKTEEQCDARYGTPYLVLPGGLARRYKMDDYDITCGFMDYEEKRVMEVCVQPLTRDKIDSDKIKLILQENSEGNSFKKTDCTKVFEKYEEPESGRVAFYYLEDDKDPTGFTKKGTLRIQTKRYQDFVIKLGEDMARAKAATTAPLPKLWPNYKAEPYSQGFIKKLEAGDSKAQCDMGWWKLYGFSGSPEVLANGSTIRRRMVSNPTESVQWFTKSADQGNTQAQKMLGDMYFKGIGVTKDEKEGLRLINLAAEQGLPEAQIFLGGCYLNGTGVAKDPKEAIKWYTKAAEQGDSNAQGSLGCFYQSGNLVAKDEKEAVKWFNMSAEQGNSAAQGSLGRCYMEGIGVDKDEKEGVKWIQKSAEQGNANWQWFLGLSYEYGRGVPKDEKQAVVWYKLAAENGNVSGQVSLGDCYLNGCGFSKDEKEAVMWYTKAADSGNPLAKRKLQEIESKSK